MRSWEAHLHRQYGVGQRFVCWGLLHLLHCLMQGPAAKPAGDTGTNESPPQLRDFPYTSMAGGSTGSDPDEYRANDRHVKWHICLSDLAVAEGLLSCSSFSKVLSAS